MFEKMFGGRKAPRTFKVVNAVNKDGCPTKFRQGRYTGNPRSAAQKAFTKLCNLKNVRGKCTFYVTVQETTRGSGKVSHDNDNNNKDKKGRVVKKEKSYMVERVKLAQPVVMFEGTDKEFKRLYATKAKAVARVPVCKVKRARTRGVMKKTSRRTNSRKAAARKAKKTARGNKKDLNSNLANNNNYRNNNQSGGRKRKSMRKKRN